MSFRNVRHLDLHPAKILIHQKKNRLFSDETYNLSGMLDIYFVFNSKYLYLYKFNNEFKKR